MAGSVRRAQEGEGVRVVVGWQHRAGKRVAGDHGRRPVVHEPVGYAGGVTAIVIRPQAKGVQRVRRQPRDPHVQSFVGPDRRGSRVNGEDKVLQQTGVGEGAGVGRYRPDAIIETRNVRTRSGYRNRQRAEGPRRVRNDRRIPLGIIEHEGLEAGLEGETRPARAVSVAEVEGQDRLGQRR